MARPVQLRYDDVSEGETVIGTYLTDDNLIQQFQMKNSGSGEYTRIEVMGDLQLKNNLPIDYSQYATSEPEILVYVLNDSGNWELRDRVFPEDAGSIKDSGDYRNAELWGFQKWVGRKKTPSRISLSNATITEIVEELLPTGYTAVTPGDDTVPTLDNYSFNGKIDKAIRDLVRDYPIKIWFTPETDGSGDYIVKVQSKGYGGVVETVTFDSERQDPGYSIIEFEEQDKSNIVNKVEVEGVKDNGDKVNAIVEDSGSISSHGERYVYRHVGYLESQTQAQNIANDILSPEPSPHARMSIPFQDQNILNASIDILDDRYGIDAVYTVVKQRDFFTEGKTEVELGFEKNRSEERRDRDRDLDEQSHRLFPSSATDVGNQIVDADTEDVTDQYDAHNDEPGDHDVGGQTFTETQDDVVENVNQGASLNIINGGSLFVDTNLDFITGDTDWTLVTVNASVTNSQGTADGWDLTIENLDTSNVPVQIDNWITGTTITDPTVRTSSFVIRGDIEGDTIRVTITNFSGVSENAQLSLSFSQVSDLTINQPSQADGAQPRADGSTNDTNPSDSSAGDTTSLSASGSTDAKNVNVATEDKTDR